MLSAKTSTDTRSVIFSLDVEDGHLLLGLPVGETIGRCGPAVVLANRLV